MVDASAGVGRSLLSRARFEEDLADELEFHLQARTQYWERRGFASAQAGRRARLEFGQIDRVKDDCWQAWGLLQVDTILKDVRYAFRRARQTPGFTTVIVLTLALGIGATSAVFALVDAVLVRRLSLSEPQRLVALWPEQAMSNVDLVFLRDRARILDDIASVAGWTVALTETTNPTQLAAEKVSANVFETLDASPLLGRTFAVREGTPRLDKIVILSYSL